MTIKAYRNYFTSKLEALYPKQEICSFFYLLTENYLGLNRVHVALNLQLEINNGTLNKLNRALAQLEKHVPIQYIIGETEFFGLPFKVNPSVLIPRPETEELVEWIIKDCFEIKQPITILDIGTGSGCIAISLANKIPYSKIDALDISAKALEIAKKNAKLNQVPIAFIEQDILALNRLDKNYDIFVSNPPYVTISEKQKMQANVLNYEPHKALFVPDENALLFYKSIAEIALKSLKPDGKLYLEINEAFGPEIVDMLGDLGFENVELRKDFFGKDRMVKATNLKIN